MKFKGGKVLLVVMLLALLAGNVLAAEAVKINLFFYKQEINTQMHELAAAFTKNHPNIDIELEMIPNDSMTVLKTRMSSGQAPDIIQLQSYSAVKEFAKAGWLLDLSKEPVMGKVVASTKNAVTYNGKQYALPMDVAGIGIIYNKAIFQKYGLNPPATFTELKKVCNALKKKGVTPFAGLFKANWSLGHIISMVHTSLAGDKLLPWLKTMEAGTGSFAKPVDVKRLFTILDFYKANVSKDAASMDWNEQQVAFATEKAAMMVQGLWSYGAAVSTNPKLDCGFIPFPCADNVKQTRLFADVDSTFALASSSSPEKQRAAKVFLEWLATPEAVKIWVEKCKLVPTFKGANVKSMQQPFQDLVSYLESGKTNPWAFSMYPVNVFEDACKNGAQEYMFGKKNATQVISYIDQTWKKESRK
ncbi:MAG TPA: extracellular solute-binding protein [Bacillota bacterium]|nr:extracellular solute-binding protein [Bacillota bacterium]